jgi:hypothetical protein
LLLMPSLPPPAPQNSALHRPGIGVRKFCENLIEPYRIAGGALRKFCEENPPAVMYGE